MATTQGVSSTAALDVQVIDERWEREKDEARAIQQSLLPEACLFGDSFEVTFRFSPYSEVGGDFADFFNLPDGRVGIYLGDVVGKGLSAAMYAALVMGTLRGIHKSGTPAATVLTVLNKRLHVRPVRGRFCATLYAAFNPVTLELAFSNAGLPYPLLASSAGCSELGKGGVPSGIFAPMEYEEYSYQLVPGDAVLFATDGLHELRNPKDEFLTAPQLAEIWKTSRKKSADESLESLFAGARAFADGPRQHDDITAVVLKVLG
jgi:phosphoserine phosphatase RsbU/P